MVPGKLHNNFHVYVHCRRYYSCTFNEAIKMIVMTWVYATLLTKRTKQGKRVVSDHKRSRLSLARLVISGEGTRDIHKSVLMMQAGPANKLRKGGKVWLHSSP